MADSEVWNVYQHDWRTVGIGTLPGDDGAAECRKLAEKYDGCLRDGDSRISEDGLVASLDLRLWLLTGVFRTQESAQEWAALVGGECKVVVRGSSDEQELIDYGTRKLAS
jgi:hypothetical protein